VDSFLFNYNGEPDTVSDYTELDVRLAWRPIEKFEISVTGQNLLHDQHLEYVNANPNPRTEIKRSVYLKATCRF
jgi:iron complex outermembrane receptor protein